MARKSNNLKKVAITNNTELMRCRLLVKLIELCGATPVLIPYQLSSKLLSSLKQNCTNEEEVKKRALEMHLANVREMLDECDALLLPGNKYDVPPAAYGVTEIHPSTQKRIPKNLKYVRFETESMMARIALEREWPILGICGGMQVMNVVLGGSLVQHLPDDPRCQKLHLNHRDPRPRNLPSNTTSYWESHFVSHLMTNNPTCLFHESHPMQVVEGSLLAAIYRDYHSYIDLSAIGELSIHHQGCFPENLGNGLKPTAFAPDGLVEAAELEEYSSMCLLTQFHGECNVSGIAKPMIQRLVDSI